MAIAHDDEMMTSEIKPARIAPITPSALFAPDATPMTKGILRIWSSDKPMIRFDHP
jgi:hypothetical protein